MRSIFIGIIVLSASVAVVDAAQAKTHLQRLPDYGYLQTPVGPQQTANNDLTSINRDNQDLELPVSQGKPIGASEVHSEEDTLTMRIDQDNVRIDREIRSICPGC